MILHYFPIILFLFEIFFPKKVIHIYSKYKLQEHRRSCQKISAKIYMYSVQHRKLGGPQMFFGVKLKCSNYICLSLANKWINNRKGWVIIVNCGKTDVRRTNLLGLWTVFRSSHAQLAIRLVFGRWSTCTSTPKHTHTHSLHKFTDAEDK